MRKTRYIAKFAIENGEIANDIEREFFEKLKAYAAANGKRAYLRYNGPRRSANPNRHPHNCQSMCLKKDATAARVYMYDY